MRTAIVVSCSVVALAACSGSGVSTTAEAPDTTPSALTNELTSGPTSTIATPTVGATVETTASAAAIPTTASSTVAESAAGLPPGFELVAARVTEPDGSTCDLCLWLAETAAQRALGLMHVTDLGPAGGMAFRYDRAHTGTFWMKNTILPLSIAFFDPDGNYMTELDMEPCTTDTCPRYATPRGFLIAVETVQGGLSAIGMVPGSRLELLERPCG